MLKVLIAGVVIFLADMLIKFMTHSYLPVMTQEYLWYPYGGIAVFQNFLGIEFSISHSINRGAAWGIFSDYQHALIVVRLILVIGLIAYLLIWNKRTALRFPLVLIIAGALGNIVDYFFYGHVVDMFHFILWGYDFPVFNLADTSIFLGICSLFLLSFRDEIVEA
jgi:signal peptidase II